MIKSPSGFSGIGTDMALLKAKPNKIVKNIKIEEILISLGLFGHRNRYGTIKSQAKNRINLPPQLQTLSLRRDLPN